MAKGFKARCMKCFAEEGSLSVQLDSTTSVTCSECGETYDVTQAVELAAGQLAKWKAVAEWAESAPRLK